MACAFVEQPGSLPHTLHAQLQTEEFNLKKPSAYNYDFGLLGVITIAFGLIGLPPINGVLPQVTALLFLTVGFLCRS